MARRGRFGPLIMVFMTLQLGACVTWSPVAVSPETLLQQAEPPQRVRVTRTDGEQLVLEGPALRAGALVATAAPGAVLVSDVRTLEVEKVSVARTIALVLPSVVVLAIVGKQACRC